ncbi:MAG: HAD family hydrolase [Candidatus Hodarchaeota archaeon]
MKESSLKSKRVIVFDLDGTIIRLTADWKSLKEYLVLEYQKIYKEKCDFKSISACLSKIVEKGDKNVLMKFFEIIRHYELENIRNNQPIKETIFFINNIELFRGNKDAKIAILSLNTKDTIIKSLELANILNKIDFIIGREDVRKWKPDPEGLLKIQDHFEINKEDMIYFGDLEKDVLTGKNAGIDAYFIEDLIKLVNKMKKKHKKD